MVLAVEVKEREKKVLGARSHTKEAAATKFIFFEENDWVQASMEMEGKLRQRDVE